MMDDHGESDGTARERVDRVLRRCQEWSRKGQHQQIIDEVEHLLAVVEDHDQLRAAMLTWKAQAQLAVGNAEAALPSAIRSWELEPTPHACHLAANALEAVGKCDESEKHLRMGWQLFPKAVHLPIQLAVLLSEQARMPEALEILDAIHIDDNLPEDFRVFLVGMRANLLGSMGRWAEAEEVLQNGLDRHPSSSLLLDAHDTLDRSRQRIRAEESLAASWRNGLDLLEGVPGEIDDAVTRCCAVNEFSEIVDLGARRLWRAYLDHRGPRPQSPDCWGVALVLAVLEIDGEMPPIAPTARSVATKPSSVRAILGRLRSFLESLDPEFKIRAFAAHSNPRLNAAPVTGERHGNTADVVPFPGT